MDEIRMLPRTLITAETPDGFAANVQLLSSTKSRPARVIGTWGCWWDHVSVSFSNRMPTWDEMAEVKRMFFKPGETCIQLHPPEEDYVNLHKFCLHIWRPQREDIPVPPPWMVGPKKGQSISEVEQIANAAMRKWQDEVSAIMHDMN